MQVYSGLQSSIRQSLTTIPTPTGKQFMKLGQSEHPTPGHFVYGVDNIVASPDAQWVLDPHTIQHGFLLRKGGASQPLDDVKVPISQFLPGTPGGISLPPNRGGIWSHAYAGIFVSVDDPKLVVEFGGDTAGIRVFYKKILDMLEKHLDTNHQGAIFPILSLSSSNYRAFNKVIHKPEFEILAFASAEQIQEFVQTASDHVEVQEQAIDAAAAPGSAPVQPLYTPPPAYAAAPQTVTDGSGVRYAVVPQSEVAQQPTPAPQPVPAPQPPPILPAPPAPQPPPAQAIPWQPPVQPPAPAQAIPPGVWQPPVVQPPAPAPVAAAPVGVPGQPPAPVAAPPAAPVAEAPADEGTTGGKMKKKTLRRRRVAKS